MVVFGAERGARGRVHAPFLIVFPGSQDDEMENGGPVAPGKMHRWGQRDVAFLLLPHGQCRWVSEEALSSFQDVQTSDGSYVHQWKI